MEEDLERFVNTNYHKEDQEGYLKFRIHNLELA